MIVQNVFPAIRAKLPLSNDVIYVQQDNAKPHFNEDDQDMLEEGSRDGFSIMFKKQPPNSPDMNVLDFGLFNTIQSVQHQHSPKTIDELISCVSNAFDELRPDKLDNVFLTLQQCMEETMLVKGGNNYKLPHIGKAKLRNNGTLPVSLTCRPEAIRMARQNIDEHTL